MSRIRLLAFGIAVATVSLSVGCGAKDPSTLHIVNLRVEEAAPGDPPDLLFAVHNRLSADDALTSITSPDAEGVTIDGTGGQVLNGSKTDLELVAQEVTRFEPGAIRIRLDRPRRPLEVGDQVQVIFTFESGVQIRLMAPVIKPGAPGPDPDHV